jgi:hypothetical protein
MDNTAIAIITAVTSRKKRKNHFGRSASFFLNSRKPSITPAAGYII